MGVFSSFCNTKTLITMRKHIFTLTMLALAGLMANARPVAPETALDLARSFVTSNFEFTRQSADLTLVQTAYSERGEACYYVFNVGETGFVILAADDNYRPIIGYSQEGVFDADDMAPALADYLGNISQSVAAAASQSSASVDVAADWSMLEKCGRLVSRHGGRADEYLVETKWNQNYPYNYYCPEAAGGPGGHCYAGCVATAAAQLMRYWCHPLQGQGSYTYYPEDHPEYGPLTANFGETTYDWENMPSQISSSSPQAQIDAVATLIYHAGVCVDMNYRPSSSGAVTGKLCQTMPQYFFYTPAMDNLYREDYTHDGYMRLVMDAIDMHWPMVHRGGGHAYVLDGYNDNDMVHFNWGWSGSSDGWFNIDEHGYTDGQSVIYNYVPAAIYSATSAAPTNLTVTPADDNSLSATISWTNPTLNLGNNALTAIDQIVVARNGQVVYSVDSVEPGADMSFTDESVPYYDIYKYAVYAVIDGQRGKSAMDGGVYIGPTCNWKIIMQSSAFQGWNGSFVTLYASTGKEIARYTITNSVPATMDIPVPIGQVAFGWTKGQTNVNNLSMTIKDAQGNTVYTYSGSAFNHPSGIFLSENNGCGNEPLLTAPYGLHGEMEDGKAVLTWNYDGEVPQYGYIVYRDEQLYGSSFEMTFVDENVVAGHCYTVVALGAGGESPFSNETCASAGDCLGATNLDFEYTGNNYKIKLKWDRPNPADGLSGYYLFRKQGEDGIYERIKLLSSSATTFTDNTAIVEGDYYYRLYAYYSATDCTSAPASIKDNPNQFYLRVYYSPTDVEEIEGIVTKVYPNPADNSLQIEAEGLVKVTIFNMLGQVAFEKDCNSDRVVVHIADWSEGLYVVSINTKAGTVSRRLSIVH